MFQGCAEELNTAPTAFAALDTPLGVLRWTVDGAEAAAETWALQPRLPPGMAVQACHAVLVTLRAAVAGDACTINAELFPRHATTAGPQTGEALEAQVWQGQAHVMAVGTDDDEALRAHGPALRLQPRFAYSATTLSVVLRPPPTGSLQLRFAVAWNPEPEPAPDACWFAVGSALAEPWQARPGRGV